MAQEETVLTVEPHPPLTQPASRLLAATVALAFVLGPLVPAIGLIGHAPTPAFAGIALAGLIVLVMATFAWRDLEAKRPRAVVRSAGISAAIGAWMAFTAFMLFPTSSGSLALALVGSLLWVSQGAAAAIAASQPEQEVPRYGWDPRLVP